MPNLQSKIKTIGSGKPLLTIHGFGPDHRIMSGCLEPIFEMRDGYRRIYFDLPGMGTTPPDEEIDNSDKMLNLIWEIADSLLPNESFLLAGESYGGYLARGMVRQQPERIDGLLLICPLVEIDPMKRKTPVHLPLVRDSEFMSRLDFDDRCEFESFAVIQTEETYRRYEKEIQSGFRLAHQGYLSRFQKYGYPLGFEVDDLKESFDKPALILAGRQDSIVGYGDAQRLLDIYPRAALAILDCAGHFLQIEQSRVFNRLVNNWLDRVENDGLM